MPDIAAHIFMGSKVLALLDAELSSRIRSDPYRFALLGPDPYIFYCFFAPPLKKGINKRGSVMHREKTGLFLTELAKASSDDDAFSYLSGFLCHYTLDTLTHPRICMVAEQRSDLHTAIEHRLDMLELEKAGQKLHTLDRLLPPYPHTPVIRQVLRQVYGWDDDHLRTSYRHMRLFYAIAKDSWGILNLLLGRIPGKLSALSYRTQRCSGVDLSWYPQLEKQAIEEAAALITAADRFRKGQLTAQQLDEMIGSRSYV